jgi:ubiquinone/menaquinone biosynthesis C-methylase UbiE
VELEGNSYQARFDALAAEGTDVHGEATFVRALQPRTVLDAGCGTGRVAIELSRHGIEVVGADISSSMLETARELAPQLDWIEADLTTLDLGRRFDVVVMAGNVLLFTEPGTEAAVVESCARHLTDGGALVAGFQLTQGYSLEQYDDACARAGLTLAERFATWDREPFEAGGDYAVSVHRRR